MPTTNPVPSTDPSDLLFNAGKLDEVVNGASNSFTDRLGVARRTVAGMNADFDAQLADAESDLNVYRADAAASAAEALGYLQTIRATSYGAYANDPTTDPLGNPPTVGDEYFNTTSNLLKRWNGTTWQASDINTANLAASSGSSLVGYDTGTVQDVLDGAKSLQNYAALRAYTGRAKRIYVTGLLVTAKPAGIAGTFQYDATDTTSSDNGGTIIVGTDGRRWKRDFSDGINIQWFGTLRNGADDTIPIQSAINAASFGFNKVIAPPGVFNVSSLYFQYDAVLNPGYNSANRAQGRIIFEGAGQCDDGQAITSDYDGKGTTIIFSGVNGAIAKKNVSPYPIRGLLIKNMTLVGNNTGHVVDFASVHTNAALRHVTVVQQHKDGGGINWLDSYMIDIEDVYAINTANGGDAAGALTITGTGFTIKNPTLAGGQYVLKQLTSHGFATGYQFGEPDYTQAAESCTQISCIGVQSLKCNYGIDLGKGVSDFDSMNLRCEQSRIRGVRVHAYARNVKLRGRFVNATATEADIVIGRLVGVDVADTVVNVSVEDATMATVNVAGIKYFPTENSVGVRFARNRFQAANTGAGVGIITPDGTLSKLANAPEVYGNIYANLATDISGPYINAKRGPVAVRLKNAEFSIDSNADGIPDDWTKYFGTGSIGSGIDPYGSGFSYRGSDGAGNDAPIYQAVKFPANTLLRISYWVKSIANAATYHVRLTDAAASSPVIVTFDQVTPTSTATLRTIYWYSGANTTGRFELRGAEFSLAKIEAVS